MDKETFFRFMRVEDYFQDAASWEALTRLASYRLAEDGRTLELTLERSDGGTCLALAQVPRGDTLRIRVNPGKQTAQEYPSGNTRAIVQDSFDDLADLADHAPTFTLSEEKKPARALVATVSYKKPLLRLRVEFDPLRMQVIKCGEKREFVVMETPARGLRFADAGRGEYAVIQSAVKPPTAKYIGFGEQGGVKLAKNTSQITYFNYDNMRYMQVYNRGPFESKEPLYHSDPFFMEAYGVPGENSAYGVYIDNPSQVCLDIGLLNSQRYMFGTRFGDLDYYLFLGDDCRGILRAFIGLIGTARLKPRYALGYHQGCYGYENRSDLEQAVRNYRQYQIPLDGLHVDVDIQKNYKTFTIDEEKFPKPKEMFANLRRMGVKCSTNITPIISNLNPYDSGNPARPDYTTYLEGEQNGYFIKDWRWDPWEADAKKYQDYWSGENHIYDYYDPEGNFNSGRSYTGEVYYGGDRGTTGHYADLGRKEVRRWWGEQYQYLFDMGLEMVWQDMTTPCIRNSRGDMRSFPARLLVTNDFIKHTEDDDQDGGEAYASDPAIKVWNLYSYNLHKATYHGLNHLSGRENKRNFIVGRGCFTGMHRFAALWTGDNASDWNFLKINIAQVLALGMTGQAMSGQDIGGFERCSDWEHWADPELLIRWTAMGAFLPWFRNHYIAKGVKYFQEPYAYQHVDKRDLPQEVWYLYDAVLPVCKYYIELRYRLLQLFYDAMFENTLNGMPICRPLFLTDFADKAVFNDKLQFMDNQFLVREDLLIAPVIDKQAGENDWGRRDIYLPATSDWYAFTDGGRPLAAAVEGGRTIAGYDAHIDSDPNHIPYIVPMYVRAGAILPMLDVEQYVGQKNETGLPHPLTFQIYPGDSGSYTLYLDDGVSRSSAPEGDPLRGADPAARGQYRETYIEHDYTDRAAKRRRVRFTRRHDGYAPKLENYFYCAILHDPSEALGANGALDKVFVNGEALAPILSGANEERAAALDKAEQNAWYFNSATRASYIKVYDDAAKIAVDLQYV